MIQSFRCSDTRALFMGLPCQQFVSIRRTAERKLQMLHRSTALQDLRSPPNNRLEKLHGDRQDCYSIRINDQWRLCFRFGNGHAHDVEIVDYH